MAKQLTIRNVPEEVAERLKRLSVERATSLNRTVVEILEKAVGVDDRRARIERYVTWTDVDLREFDEALASQRLIAGELWN